MDDFLTHVSADAGYTIDRIFVTQRLAAVSFESLERGVTLDFPNALDQTKALRLLLLAQDVAAAVQGLRDFADALERETTSRPPSIRQ